MSRVSQRFETLQLKLNIFAALRCIGLVEELARPEIPERRDQSTGQLTEDQQIVDLYWRLGKQFVPDSRTKTQVASEAMS